MTPGDYDGLFDELIENNHRRAIIGLWLDVFDEFFMRNVLMVEGIRTEEGPVELEQNSDTGKMILAESFSKLRSGAQRESDLETDEMDFVRAGMCKQAIEEICADAVRQIFKYLHNSEEWPAHIRDALMEIWNDQDGNMVAARIQEHRARSKGN